METNLRAPLLIIRATLPHFRRQGGGVVVNVGSVNALCGENALLAYSIAKGGMMTMTRNLASAHAAEKIRVNQINVGWTLTENELKLKHRDGLPKGWQFHLPREFAPTGRLLSPEQVASHIVFWLSDASHPINGAVYEAEQYTVYGRNAPKEV